MRSVWSRVASGSITVVTPGRVEAGEQHRRLHLRRGHRRSVDDRQRIGGAAQRQRQAAALGRSTRPRRPSRSSGVEHARIGRLRSEASPSKRGGDRHGRRRRPSSAASRCRHCRNRARSAGSARPPTPTPCDAPGARPGRARPWRRARAGVAPWRARPRPRAGPRSSSRRRRAGRRSASGARSTCRPARARGPRAAPARRRRAGSECGRALTRRLRCVSAALLARAIGRLTTAARPAKARRRLALDRAGSANCSRLRSRISP